MSGLDQDRYRNHSLAFRVTGDERETIDARIKVSGLPRGEYFRGLALNGAVQISVGKYQSDRLSVELKRLRLALEANCEGVCNEICTECLELLRALYQITAPQKEEPEEPFIVKK